MPPFVPRKRSRSRTPPPKSKGATPRSSSRKSATNTKSKANKKPNLFEVVDSESTATPTLADNEAFLEEAQDGESDSSDDSSEASELDSDDFEDAMQSSSQKRRKLDADGPASRNKAHSKTGDSSSEDEEDDDDEMEWEDATKHTAEPVVSGDLELTLDELPEQATSSFTNPHGQKKGPSKIERQIRTYAHCMHVQSLMYHNFLRNKWLCDKELHKILLAKIPSWMMREAEKYKAAVGIQPEGATKDADSMSKSEKTPNSAKKTSKKHKNQRDWGNNASHSEHDVPFLTAGDPTIPFLRILLSFWRKKFNPTAPGLRKTGYREMARLEQELKSLRHDDHDPEDHGERLKNVAELRELAKKCIGSRDVGAQLFTALLRAIGLEARMTASLQPIGFGWSKNEEAAPPRKKDKNKSASKLSTDKAHQDDKSDTTKQKNAKNKALEANLKPQRPGVSGSRGHPISLLDDDESELSSVPDSDDDSVLEVMPKEPMVSSKRYDRDLSFPIYWTEVLSPISQTWIPLDPIVLSIIIGKPEDFMKFEPRGPRAEKAKQVFGYVVSFSADGSAKDVTVRYMKNRMWPGKTKGVRIPVERIPIHNRRGKVDHYEDFDWFKTVMRIYTKSSQNRTPADDIEDARELVPVKPNRQSTNAKEETLQGYKKSAEYVLERHLRREEALLPNAKQVKTFKTGKGENEKTEPVYRRADVVNCKSTESWHKEGLEVKEGEQPLKHVPMRAVTTIRKREIEEAERESGEKLKQGLYARYQTDWIIPPPIEDGVIPKNAFGNMDVYVPTMVPRGAIHVPLRGTAKICRKLGIDHAEACTGFEFGNRMAVPILTGVVVAEENEHAVIDAWETEEAEKKRKEKIKREKTALSMWKKMLGGLKVLERVKKQYGEGAELQFDSLKLSSSAKKGKTTKASSKSSKGTESRDDSYIAGDPEDGSTQLGNNAEMDIGEGGFLRDSDMIDNYDGGGFILENGEGKKTKTTNGRSPEALAKTQTPEPSRVEQEMVLNQSEHHLDNSDHHDNDNDVLETNPAPKTSGARTRKRPSKKAFKEQPAPAKGRRNASRKSKETVRSRYFEGNSDVDSDVD